MSIYEGQLRLGGWRQSERGEIETVWTCRGEMLGYIGRRMLKMELLCKRKGGRPGRRFMDVVREDMQVVGATKEDAEDRERWKQMIRSGDPWQEQPRKE